VKALLRAGANPNLPAGFGFTPLHEAAEAGHADVVKVLLAHGADPRLKLAAAYERFPVGATAAQVARLAGHQKLGALFFSVNRE